MALSDSRGWQLLGVVFASLQVRPLPVLPFIGQTLSLRHSPAVAPAAVQDPSSHHRPLDAPCLQPCKAAPFSAPLPTVPCCTLSLVLPTTHTAASCCSGRPGRSLVPRADQLLHRATSHHYVEQRHRLCGRVWIRVGRPAARDRWVRLAVPRQHGSWARVQMRAAWRCVLVS